MFYLYGNFSRELGKAGSVNMKHCALSIRKITMNETSPVTFETFLLLFNQRLELVVSSRRNFYISNDATVNNENVVHLINCEFSNFMKCQPACPLSWLLRHLPKIKLIVNLAKEKKMIY